MRSKAPAPRSPIVRPSVFGACVLGLIVALTLGWIMSSCGAGGAPRDRYYASWQEALSKARLIAASLPEYDPDPAFYHEPSDAQLTAALERVRALCDGLVLYACSPFEMRLLKEADRQGFRAVMLGVWDPNNADELERVVEAVEQWPHMIYAICVGNEGLLFDRYGRQDLEQAAAYLRAHSPGVPLTTSEPIGAYGDPFLQNFGDGLLAPNVHPWFANEREPEEAVAWVTERTRALCELVGTGKFVFVKETGLPSGGDPDASPEKQAQFWARLAAALPIAPNMGAAYFEAHDLPWKARDSGMPIEEHWGFWQVDGTPKPVVAALSE